MIQGWGGVAPGMIRGTAEMGIGVMTAHFFTQKEITLNNHRILLDVLSLLSLTCFLLVVLAEKSFDYLTLIASPILVLSCFIKGSFLQKVFKHAIWNKLGSLTMEMLCIQAFCGSLYWIIGQRINIIYEIPAHVMVLIYLSAVTISALLLKLLVNRITHA